MVNVAGLHLTSRKMPNSRSGFVFFLSKLVAYEAVVVGSLFKWDHFGWDVNIPPLTWQNA